MRILALLLLAGLGASSAAVAKQPITASDVLKIRRITDVRVAANGAFAIYGVQSIHTERATPKAEPVLSYRTHLWWVDLNAKSSPPRQLTFGDRSDSGFAISPDGTTLAFVRSAPARDSAKDPAKTVPQIWLLPLNGPGEPRQITHLERGATNPIWHPQGREILVSTATPLSKLEAKPHFASERPGRDWFDFERPGKEDKSDDSIQPRPDGDRAEIRQWLERNSSKDNPFTINRLAFQAEMGLRTEMPITHLYRIDLEHENKASALTKGSISLHDCAYSPDGATLVCAGPPAGNDHPDRTRREALWTLNANGSNLRILLDNPQESFSRAVFYPDGQSLLITAAESDEPNFRQTRLLRYRLSDRQLSPVGVAWKGSVQQSQVAADNTVYFNSSWHGGAPLLAIRGGQLTPLIDGPVGVSEFEEGGGRIVYSLIRAENPNELYLRDRDGSTRVLTTLNSDWLAGKQLVLPQEKWITRPDGTKVQTWSMNPAAARDGKKYPWVLDMHGGPTAMWGPGEFSMWHEFQLLCAWGYGVVYSNPRGSGGYGYEFQKANFKNWGEGPAADVLAALDETVRTNPFVDKDRLFLTGGSYAGYLTAWIVGHDHRFKAAASQRGVYDLTTFYGEGNAYRLVENDFGGRPYDENTRRLLDQQSPFTYVKNIRTPLLILHGSQDLRTGVTQSEMLYRALKDQGKPVEYVRYPGASHELTRSGAPLQRMDHMLRIIEFFERYSRNDAPAPMETK
jgi:dipeptidyl aminopeptidase/acylaminoacyl peptidase